MIKPEEREEKKKELRKKILSIDEVRNEEEKIEKLRELKRKRDRRNRTIIIIALALAMLFAVLKFFYHRYYTYKTYQIREEIELSEGSLIGYESFAGNIIKYSRDGITLMDKKGKEMWVDTYEMREPTLKKSKNYILLFDKQGNVLKIYGKDGISGFAGTTLPIKKAVISDTGVVAVLLEDGDGTYISFFTKTGEALQVTIRTVLSGNGYPLDMALSPNGTQLMVSYQYLEGASLRGRVVFYDFSEIGQNIPTRLVGGFDEPFYESIIPRVVFLNTERSFALADTGLYFFSSKNLASPKLLESILIEEELVSLAYSDRYIVLVKKRADDAAGMEMLVYTENGDVVSRKNITFTYDKVDISGENIFFYIGSELAIYNIYGVEKFHADLGLHIQYVLKSGFDWLIFGNSKINRIRMK